MLYYPCHLSNIFFCSSDVFLEFSGIKSCGLLQLLVYEILQKLIYRIVLVDSNKAIAL